MTDWIELTALILEFLQVWDGVIHPKLARFWRWLRAPQPVPNPEPGGHVLRPGDAAVGETNSILLRMEHEQRELRGELSGIRDELLNLRTQLSQPASAADLVPQSDPQ